jgi:hypothetical protein
MPGRRLNRQQYFKDPVAYTCTVYHRFGLVSGLTHGDRQHFFAFGAEHNRAVPTGDSTFRTVLEALGHARQEEHVLPDCRSERA